MLARGDRGNGVRRLQALLSRQGFDARPIDGRFGQVTAGAVARFQIHRGLVQSGAVDQATASAVGLDGPDVTTVAQPMIAALSADHVAAMFSRRTPRRNIKTHLPNVLAALAEAGLDDRDMVILALATIRAETAAFLPIDERISRFNTSPGGRPFDLYDQRHDLGNRGAPDGERFKGRGFIQLTGRANYESIGAQLGLATQLLQAPALANESTVAARILALFLKNRRQAAKYAIFGDDLPTARKLVNGGRHGLARFTAAFRIGLEVLPQGDAD